MSTDLINTTSKFYKDLKAEAELGRELISILMGHTGESGDNEGAAETLRRIIAERTALRTSLPMGRGEVSPEVEAAIGRLKTHLECDNEEKDLEILIAAYRLSSQGPQPDPGIERLGQLIREMRKCVKGIEPVNTPDAPGEWNEDWDLETLTELFNDSYNLVTDTEPRPLSLEELWNGEPLYRHPSGGEGLRDAVKKVRAYFAVKSEVGFEPTDRLIGYGEIVEQLDAILRSDRDASVDAALSRDGEGRQT